MSNTDSDSDSSVYSECSACNGRGCIRSTRPRMKRGIVKPFVVAPCVLKFLGEPPYTWLSRVEGMKRLVEYTRINDLRFGSHVHVDDKLAKLLNLKSSSILTFFDMIRRALRLFPNRSKVTEQCAVNMQKLYRGKIGRRSALLKLLEPDNLLDPQFKESRLARFGLSGTANRMN
jgi:hypothetical protein